MTGDFKRNIVCRKKDRETTGGGRDCRYTDQVSGGLCSVQENGATETSVPTGQDFTESKRIMKSRGWKAGRIIPR